jgi:cytochrome c553
MKLTQRIGVIAALLVPLTAGAAGGAGDPELGRMKSNTCTACHGADGKGIAPIYPVIAGQYADYLAHALTQYRSGKRSNPIMMGIAAGLSDDDIADLAAYYAHLPGLATPKK